MMDDTLVQLESNAASAPPVAGGWLRLRRRLVASLVAAAAGAVLVMAAWMTPSETGLGTHSQLNLPACGWIAIADMPCPTCGMTTAFAHAADGHFLRSFLAQPLGCVLAMATAMTLLVSLHIAATGSSMGHRLRRLWGVRTAWMLGVSVLLAWGFKILSYKDII